MANNPIWPAGPISSASTIPLSSNPGTLPNMADTVSGWFQLLVFSKLTKTTVNFQIVEVAVPVQFQGVVVPEPRKLVMASNGQRRWKSKTVFAWPNVPLDPDDVVTYEGITYRVMQGADYTQYGFVQYWLTEDYVE